MVIDRSKHNRYTTNAIYGNLTSGGIVTDKDGNISGTEGLTYLGGVIMIGGGGGSISPELIAQLTNQDAFSYLNVSDGINTVNVEAKLEKDYINLNILGDNETVETKVSTEKYLPETYYEGTGSKPGRYSVAYNKVTSPGIVDGKPVDITKWVITINKIYGNPIFASTDFNGVLLLEEGISLGAYALNSSKLSVTSDPVTGLLQIVMLLDNQLNFTEIRLISSEDYTTSAYNTIVAIKDIVIQTFTTILIQQANATKYWQLDENGKLFTNYDVYTTKTLGANDKIWSDKGYEVGDFVQGVSGGVFHVNDALGTTYAEMDKLRVRKKAYFETLEIVNVNTVGGKLIISPAGAITIRKVETYDTYYRCYFLGELDGVEIENRFRVNDLAFSLNFNIRKPGEYESVANHYYWRLVVGVSTTVDSDSNHYIDLSIINCDTDSDIPHVNDVVAQLGNTTDPDRQSAMIFSSVDSESPRIILCHGINTYTLNATNYFDLGVDHSTNKAYMNVYGNTYIGAKDNSSYINYSITNGLNIRARISASSTYGDKPFSEVFVTSESLSDRVSAVVGDDITSLLNQIDGNIESYFYEYSPTLNNYPADTWLTDTEKQRHNGDTFTNIQEYVSDTETPDAGKSWRWVKNSAGVWGWIQISDSDAVAALKKAGEAQDTADGKCKTFTQKPGVNDSYDVGDLWVNATFTDSTGLLLYENDLLRAHTAKPKGLLFDIAHWELASKYTDNTLAEDAQAKADAAQAAADAAGTAANTALTSINNYKTEIDGIFSDGVITTSERSRLNTLTDTIKTTLFDVLTTYNDVYNNSALTDESGNDKIQKTTLKRAYDAFSNSANVLLNTVATVIAKDTITKGDISSVDLAYTNFNTDYTDYVGALGSANLEIMTTLGNIAYNNAVDNFAWLNGLFDPSLETEINGGVVTTGVLALGKKDNNVFVPNAGMSGIQDDGAVGKGIAIWFGGDMLDKDNYTAGLRPDRVATSLLRYDGSGYLGYKRNTDPNKDLAGIWWDSTGNVHANPLSFFVGPEDVGALMLSFHVVTAGATPLYIVPKVPFQHLQIGNGYLGYDAVNNAIYVYTKDSNGNEIACNFYANGAVSAKGANSDEGGGGLDVAAMWDILGAKGTEQIHPSHITTALSTYATQDWVTELLSGVTTGGSWDSITGKPTVFPTNWDNVANKPSWIGSNKPSYTFSEITSKPTTLSGYGITDVYTKTESDNKYPTKAGVGASGTWVISITGSANHLTTNYNGSRQTDPQAYFNGTVGVKVAMTGSASSSYWNDTLWINGYSGGDVSNMCALHLNRDGNPRMFISSQQNTATSYGTLYEILSTYNYSTILDGRYYTETESDNRYYTKETSDSRYVNAAGDTMTGLLHINANSTTFDIGGQSSTYVHLYSNVPCIFNKNLYVTGEIYAGANFNQLVWNAGNDGHNSGLDADLLDGRHGSSYAIAWTTSINTDPSSNNTESTSITDFLAKLNVSGLFGNNFGFMRGSWWIVGNIKYNTGVGTLQLAGTSVLNMSNGTGASANNKTLLFLEGNTGNMYSYVSQDSVEYWSRYAKTTDNVASASRLLNPQTIWGQSFNGTAPVSGNMTGVGSISMSGSISGATSIRIGNGVLKWDETNQGFYVEKYGGGNAGFYATSYLSAKGANSNSGSGSGGGLIQTVYGYSDLGRSFNNSNLTDTFNAYTINQLATRIAAIETNSGGGGGTIDAYTKTESDNRYVNVAGDTMTGAFQLNSTYRQLYQASAVGAVVHSILNYSTAPYGLITRIYGDGKVSLQSQRENTSSEYFKLSLNPSGGEVLINDNKAWHAGNDGSGSGLDADLLDGVHNGDLTAKKLKTSRTIWGQSFNGETSVSGNMTGVGSIDASGSISANTFYADGWFRSYGDTGWYSQDHGGGWYMTEANYVKAYNNKVIYNDGYRAWGINGNNMGLKLYNSLHIGINLANDVCTWGIYSNKNGNMYIGRRNGKADDSSGSYIAFFTPSGLTVNGSVTQTSDMRLKNKLNDVLVDVHAIANAPSFSFTWKNNGFRDAGSSAQYWMGVLPDTVKESDGYYGMEYGNIALLSAISLAKYTLSIATRTETLEEKVNRLEKENNDMRIQIEELENLIHNTDY